MGKRIAGMNQIPQGWLSYGFLYDTVASDTKRKWKRFIMRFSSPFSQASVVCPCLPSTPHIHTHTHTRKHTCTGTYNQRPTHTTHTHTHKSGDIAEAAANIQKLHYISDFNIHKLLASKESCKLMQSLYIDIRF